MDARARGAGARLVLDEMTFQQAASRFPHAHADWKKQTEARRSGRKQAVLEGWEAKCITGIPNWGAAYAADNLCLAYNNAAGRGCQRGAVCRFEHVCLFCKQKDHGVSMERHARATGACEWTCDRRRKFDQDMREISSMDACSETREISSDVVAWFSCLEAKHNRAERERDGERERANEQAEAQRAASAKGDFSMLLVDSAESDESSDSSEDEAPALPAEPEMPTKTCAKCKKQRQQPAFSPEAWSIKSKDKKKRRCLQCAPLCSISRPEYQWENGHHDWCGRCMCPQFLCFSTFVYPAAAR